MHLYNPDANTTPDEETAKHIATMVDRALAFFRRYGPMLVERFTTFGGYTDTVDAGDGDYVTLDTLWDFKVSVNPPTKDDTLQLIMYWLMARRSDWNWRLGWNLKRSTSEAEWSEVWNLHQHLQENRSWPEDLRGPAPTHIGVYNPRLDAVYRLSVQSVPADVISVISHDVLGYE